MPRSYARRALTAEEQQSADNLKALYQAEKHKRKQLGQGLTQDDLAEWLDITNSAVSQYINGHIPLNLSAASRFAEFFKVPVHTISPELAATIPGYTASSRLRTEANAIPVLSWKQALDWQSELRQFLVDSNSERRLVTCPCSHTKNAYALIAQGDSLKHPGSSLSLNDNDILHVDPGAKTKQNSLVIVGMKGSPAAFCRQLIIEGEQRYLKSLNPDWPDRIIKMPDDATICGVVIARTTIF